MQNRRAYITLGIFIAVIPLLGLPSLMKTIIFVVLGLSVATNAFLSGRGGTSKISNRKAVSSVEERDDENEDE